MLLHFQPASERGAPTGAPTGELSGPRPAQERDWRRLDALFSQRYSLDPHAPPLPGDPPLVRHHRGRGCWQHVAMPPGVATPGRKGGAVRSARPYHSRVRRQRFLPSRTLSSPQVCAVKEGDVTRLHALLYFGGSLDTETSSAEPGADAADAHGASALVHAAVRGNVPAARLLLAHGADADWQASGVGGGPRPGFLAAAPAYACWPTCAC